MAESKITWAITPWVANPVRMLNAAAVGAAGAVTLLTTEPSINQCGYQLIFTSVGNSLGMTYTIVGEKVGQTVGTTTEVITGPNATTGTSTNYYSTIISITASAAATGNQSIGITGNLALPRCRIHAVTIVGAAAAGTVDVAMSGSGKNILHVDTPASAAFSQFVDTGALMVASSVKDDFAIITLSQVSKLTFICS